MESMESIEVLSMAAALEGEALVEAEQSLRELTMRATAVTLKEARLLDGSEKEKDQNLQDVFCLAQGKPLLETSAASSTAPLRRFSSRSWLCCCVGFLLKAEEVKLEAERKRLREERHQLESDRQRLQEEKCRHIADKLREDAKDKLRIRDSHRRAAEQEWLEHERKRLDADRKALEERWFRREQEDKMRQKEEAALVSSRDQLKAAEEPKDDFPQGHFEESCIAKHVGAEQLALGLPKPVRGDPDPELYLQSETTGNSSDCNGPAGTRLFRSCCDTIVPPRSSIVKPDGQHFSVNLERTKGDRLGVRLDKMSTANYLIIREVYAEGTVAQWNSKCDCNRRILVGDCLYRVNGLFGSGEALLQQLSEDGPSLLQLRLWRPNPKTRAKIERLGHVDFLGSPCGKGHSVADSLVQKQRQLPSLDVDLRAFTKSTSALSADSMEPCSSPRSTTVPSVESSVVSVKDLRQPMQAANVQSATSSVPTLYLI